VIEQPNPITPVPDVAAHLRNVHAIVEASASRALPGTLLQDALERTESFAAATGQPAEEAGVGYVAEILAATWLEPGWTRRGLERLFRRVAAASAMAPTTARASMFVRAIRDGSLFELPPRIAVETQLQMLAAFTATDEVSLWVGGDGGRVDSLLEVGVSPSRRARAVAANAIATNAVVTGGRQQLHAVPVHGWDGADAAIVVRVPIERREATLALAAECARAVKPLLEVEGLIERHAARERSIAESSERRFVRLGLDLHDGPMQDLAALAQDVRLYRKQLAPFVEGLAEQPILLGRLDDLDARLLVMDSALRELARSLQAPTALSAPLLDLLRGDIERFQERTEIRVELAASGDFEGLTSSQKIALVRVVNEALNNVHEHSGADAATVSVVGETSTLVVEVADEGEGFDVEARLVAAARSGRLGLVGMSERVRLLGGRFDLQSKPGGPTRVRATITRWRPLRGGDDRGE
jgi:signal transduction histidine kinase